MRPFFKTVMLITLLTGTLDIISAFIHIYINTGKFAYWIFRGIAGGLLGLETAMAGGWVTGFFGFFIHYFIAFSFTLFYFLIYPHVPLLSRNKFVSGVIYGEFIWAVMNLVVLPLSALPTRPLRLSNEVVGMIVLPLVVGMPIALAAARYFKNNRPKGGTIIKTPAVQ